MRKCNASFNVISRRFQTIVEIVFFCFILIMFCSPSWCCYHPLHRNINSSIRFIFHYLFNLNTTSKIFERKLRSCLDKSLSHAICKSFVNTMSDVNIRSLKYIRIALHTYSIVPQIFKRLYNLSLCLETTKIISTFIHFHIKANEMLDTYRCSNS